MKIEFVGAAGSVTGSCFIIKNDKYTIMVDHGMFQGNRALRDRNQLETVYAPGKIDALLLTHAHIDHSGLIPKMVKGGYVNKIFATKPTVDLCSIMLPDSAHIQESDVKWTNKRNRRKGLDLVEPLYTVEHAAESMKHFVPVNYNDMVDIVPGVMARFRNAGHILGSAFIELWLEEKGKTLKMAISGDLGTKNQPLIRDPEQLEEADVLLIESTYGDRLHRTKEDTYAEFRDIIKESHNARGNIIIPSFAVERTQEIVFILGQLIKDGAIPELPVYIDSPLAISATEIFKKNRECFDEETMKVILSGDRPLDFPGLTYIRETADSKRLNKEAKGSIIISASGMCNAGRIQHHLLNNLYKPESSVIFVGYQAEGTPGRRLVEGSKTIRMLGEEVMVKAKVHTLGGFSAHADRDGLLNWIGGIKNDRLRVFVVHGEEKSSQSFSASVKERFGYDTHVPQWGETVDLETMESTFSEYSKALEPAELDNSIADLKSGLDQLILKYQAAKAKRKNNDLYKIENDINDLKSMIRSISEDI